MLAGVVGAVWLLHRELDLAQYFATDRIPATVDAIRTWMKQFGAWGTVLFVAACALAMLANFPSALIICLSVILFGPVAGGILSFLVIASGLSLIYLVAQRLGRPVVKGLFPESFEKIEKLATRRELVNVIAVRLIFYMNPASNWLLSVSGIRYRNLLLGTLLGAGPGILLNVWLAGAVLELFQGAPSGRWFRSLDWRFLIPVALAASVLLGVRFWERRRRGPQSEPNASR
jgi:uncharacterized membrane protein YdjX (TVP38/TMEM64 family)